MKRFVIGALATVGFVVLWACSAQAIGKTFDVLADSDNLFTFPGQPRTYLVTPRYDRVDRVFVKELVSSRKGAEAVELPRGTWTFRPETNSLTIDRTVDQEKFKVYVTGSRTKPYTLVSAVPVVEDSIRVAIDGRVGIRGQDFRFDRKANAIVLPNLGTTFMVEYAFADGTSMTCGDFRPETMTRTMTRYFQWPETGNTTPKPGFPGVYTPNETLSTVWMVSLLPVADNEYGITLRDGDWTFDSQKQELTVTRSFDPGRYTVYAFGNSR